jgi:P-type conjugative transfer protein TrbG
MNRHSILILASAIPLGACACASASAAVAARPPQAAFLAASLLKDQPVLAAPVHPAKVAHSSMVRSSSARSGAGKPLTQVQAANRDAVREPSADNFLGAVQVYPWSDGALYRLYAAPCEVSDIALQPGEALVSVAAGDTVRWIIGDTTSGSGANRRTHILVKPTAIGLATNLVIATDRRVYHVEAESNARTLLTSISWTYPEDALVALRGAASATSATSAPVAAGVSVDALNFNYRIDGDDVPWRPVRAFDDGREVFIQFPPSLAQGEAPPLFVTGANGRAELVNYRIRGLYYVVDRLFAAAELRMGEKRQQVVRILRGADPRQGRRGR